MQNHRTSNCRTYRLKTTRHGFTPSMHQRAAAWWSPDSHTANICSWSVMSKMIKSMPAGCELMFALQGDRHLALRKASIRFLPWHNALFIFKGPASFSNPFKSPSPDKFQTLSGRIELGKLQASSLLLSRLTLRISTSSQCKLVGD